jgi:hypothetical protein
MPVICPNCRTANRDAAMFCHGCARKLPAFKSSQPSYLQTLRASRPPGVPATAPGPVRIADRRARATWTRVGAVLLVVALGIGAWVAHVTRAVPAPPPKAAPLVEGAPMKAPPERVPLDASLAPEEVEAVSGPPVGRVDAARPPAPAIAAVPAPVAPPAPERRRHAPRAAPPPRVSALDPRRGCETLNFVFAARCEAAHCDKPEYTHHPRCDLVREERRRDEARRNPTLIF